MWIHLLKRKSILIGYMVFMILAQIFGTGFGLIMSALVDCANKDVETVIRTIVFSLVYILICVIVQGLNVYMGNLMRTEMRTQLKQKVFGALMKRSIGRFKEENTSDYINELSNNLSMYEELYFYSVQDIPGLIVQFITASVFCIYIEPYMLILMIALSLLTWLITSISEKWLEAGGNRLVEATEEYMNEINDDFRGHRIIKNAGILNFILQRHHASNRKMEYAKYSLSNIRILCGYLGEFVGLLSTVLVMGVSAYFVVRGRFSIGLVIAFGHMIGNIVSPITTMPSIIANLKAAKPLTERYKAIMEEEVIEEDEKQVEFKEGIRLRNVTFSYEEDRPVINNMDLYIKKGKKYLIRGESGSGKSTLLELIQGIYGNYDGEILMDGKNINVYTEAELQSLFGVVTQDTFLFNDTIYNNITLFNEKYSEAEIKAVIEKAGLSEFMKRLKDGRDTIVEENGKNVSGGEKQRIALARALLAGRQILLLDEPTANLDEKNAKDIEHQILKLEDKTVLMISHDKTGICADNFDEVINLV